MITNILALDYFRHVASVLGDDEPNNPFRRYTLDDLVHAYNDGMALVYAHSPDKFAKLIRYKLEAGTRQDVSHICDNVLQVVEQVTATGDYIKSISTAKTRQPTGGRKMAWSMKKDRAIIHTNADGTPKQYIIASANIDPDTNTYLMIYPPVPACEEAYVVLKCVVPPERISTCDVLSGKALISSSQHSSAVQHYIIFKMLTGDRYATDAKAMADTHVQLFYNMLNIDKASEIESERNNETDT